ncbi:6-pyruvoyl tetrahydrobiopterin synthase [Agrobacterium rhizogenes]|nr:6-carboxytetrahydropterin synthase [Rhizobium rhizogenes]NTF59374.1 6-pyruvoyl tetrahydrobiopterin synthase [Rhizobium rhizogenes]NTF78959.1 6-pyruvoyl tetrahydrobiopterin synthase [Rhizobium rhizogenes]NTJ51488.1 6-pyruvoyl tetrahydrobiopterin synthase [Rhizobium rhizogenes]
MADQSYLSTPDHRSLPAVYRSTKNYEHNEGLSCCFRQWRASDSHCQYIHGYALAFKFTFATHELDQRNWCFDFGGLKEIRTWLHSYFDHTMIVAEDDPHRPTFEMLAANKLVDLRILPAVGCESVARFVHEYVSEFVIAHTFGRVWLEAVEVREHSGNSASYQPTQIR